MSARLFLILTLFANLLFAPQAKPVAPVSATMPGCAMMTCVNGCCLQMACCVKSAQDQRRPEQAPAPKGIHVELAAPVPRTVSVLYVLLIVESHLVIHEKALVAYTLPRLAATCIQLI
jgi:hypothetical protein